VEQQQQPWASRNFGAAAAAAPAAAAAEGPAVFSIAMMTELQSQAARRQELTPQAQRVPLALTTAGRPGSGDATAAARKPRKTGTERFEAILDKTDLKVSQSKQIKQIKIDLLRLLLTTGAHSALIVIPESWRVHKFATAGDFNSFLEIYATALEAQRKRQRRAVALSIDEVWERFQGQGGLHQIEGLCTALLKEGCDGGVVDEAKDAYLAALVSNDDAAEVKKSMSRHLMRALRGFIDENS